MDVWKEYEENKVGEIFLNEIYLELNNREQNKAKLSNLLNKAVCVKDYGIMGQGDVEYRWVFLKNNLLIGIFGISYSGGPIRVAGNYKVYRLSKQHTKNEHTVENIEKLLFPY